VPVRITFAIPFVNLTGGIRTILDFADWLHEAGHHVTVVHPFWPYRYHFGRRDQIAVLRQNLRSGPRVAWRTVRCRLRRVPVIADAFLPRADLVIATSWPIVPDVARLGTSRGGKVHLVFHHESGTGPEDRIESTYGLPFYRIAMSRMVSNAIEQQFGCRIDDIVPAGIDPTVFFPDGSPDRDTVFVLYHDQPRKGAAEAIAALTLLRERRPGVVVRMCGAVPPKDLPSWISFTLNPADAILRKTYSSATVFLYPSLYEGFGLPPLEAMACGCPVVTTAVGAVPEFAEHRRTALVVQPGDIRGMADCLEEALLDGTLRATLSRGGRETARRYALSQVAPRFGEALQRALDRRRESLDTAPAKGRPASGR